MGLGCHRTILFQVCALNLIPHIVLLPTEADTATGKAKQH